MSVLKDLKKFIETNPNFPTSDLHRWIDKYPVSAARDITDSERIDAKQGLYVSRYVTDHWGVSKVLVYNLITERWIDRDSEEGKLFIDLSNVIFRNRHDEVIL